MEQPNTKPTDGQMQLIEQTFNGIQGYLDLVKEKLMRENHLDLAHASLITTTAVISLADAMRKQWGLDGEAPHLRTTEDPT